MATRVVLVTSSLVAMATLVASQALPPTCDRFPPPTKEKSTKIVPTLEMSEGIALIAGVGGFALLVAVLFILMR